MRTIVIIAFVLLALNCFAAAPGDGWFFGWSNGAPAWIINGGLVTNVNLTSATNEALLIGLNGTNNSVAVSNNLQTAITNEDLLIGSNGTNEATRVSNNATNQSLKIGSNDTNEVARVSALCTNESLLIGSNGTNESTRISNNATNQSAVVSNALFALVDKRVLTNDTRALSLAGPIFDTNITASRMVFASSANQLTAAAASGAVPLDADGSATTFPQVQALASSVILTNGNLNDVTMSNAFRLDAQHALSLSNLTASHVLQVGADSTVSSVSSGAVPIDGNGAATTFAQVNALASAFILTNNETLGIVLSNTVALDAQHALSLSNLTTGHVLQVGADSTVSSVSSGAVPVDGNGSATTFPQIQALAPSVILTNGGTSAITYSNVFRLDAQHALSLSNLTTSHVLQVGADSTVSSVSSGTVPIDGDGTATTFAQVNALGGGSIVTNGESLAITVSNTWTVDATHFMTGPVSATTLTNSGGTANTLAISDANNKLVGLANGSSTTVLVGGAPPSFTTVPDGAMAAPSITAVSGNTGGWSEFKVAGSDFTRTAQSLADVTGLVTGTVSVSSVYDLDAFLLVTSSSSAGVQFGVQCTGSGATCGIVFDGATTTTLGTNVSVNALTTAEVASFCTGSQTSFVRIHGFVNSGTGSPAISIQALKTTSGTATVKVGSVMRIRKM